MYVEQEVHDIAAVSVDLVVALSAILLPLTGGVNVVPVYFQTGAVVACGKVSRQGKNRRVVACASSGLVLSQTVLVLVEGERNELAAHGGRTVIIEHSVEASVTVVVNVEVAVHGVARVVHRGGQPVAGHSRCLTVEHLSVDGVGHIRAQRHSALTALGGRNGEAVELAVSAGDGEAGVEVQGVVVGGLSRVAAEVGNEYYVAVDVLGRDGVAIVAEEVGADGRVDILRSVIDQAVAIEVEAVAQDEVGESESRGGLYLDGIGLPEGNGLLGKVAAVSFEHIAVQATAIGTRATRYGHLVAVYDESGVNDRSAIAQNGVVGRRTAAGVYIVPVYLVAHTVHAGFQVCRNGEGGRCHTGIVARRGSRTVLAVEVGVGHEVGRLGEVAVAVISHVELAVAVHVEEHVAVHPGAVPAEAGRDVLSCLGGERIT